MKPTLLSLVLALLGISVAHAVAPANDSIANPLDITAPYQLVTNQNVSLATFSSMDPDLGTGTQPKSLWYRIKHTANMPDKKLVIEVRSTTGAGQLTMLSAMDRDNPAGSLQFRDTGTTFTAGQTVTTTMVDFKDEPFYIMLTGTGTVDLVFRLSEVVNDFPSTAEVLTGDFGTLQQHDNAGATNSQDEPAVSSSLNTVWFKWTPTFTDVACVDTNFSFVSGSSGSASFPSEVHKTHLSVYTLSGQTFTLVNHDTDGGWNENSYLTFNATAGTTYYIGVGTYYQSPGKFEFHYWRASTTSSINMDISPEVLEGTPNAIFVVRRRYGSPTAAPSCTFTTSNDTATAGADYVAKTTTVNFAQAQGATDGAWEQRVGVSVINDSTAEAVAEIFLATLSNASSATLGITQAAGVIYDDEAPVAVDYSVQFPMLRVSEHDLVAYNRFTRTGTSSEALSVTQTQTYGSARPGIDYIASPAYMAANETSVLLDVAIQDNDVFEADKAIYFSLPGGTGYWLTIEDDDPYIPVSGRIVGYLAYANEGSFEGRGSVLYATMSSLGVLTGKLIIVGQTLPFTTKLDTRGKATVLLAPKGRPTFALSFKATDATGGFLVTLLDSATNATGTSEVVLQNYAPVIHPCPEAASYTFDGTGQGTIHVSVVGSITVDTSGRATVAGRLFDGTPFTSAGYVDGSGKLCSLSSLYSNQGLVGLSGDLPHSNNQIEVQFGMVSRPARLGVAGKLPGVAMGPFINVCRYTAPAAGQRALDIWAGGTGTARLSGGGLASTLNKAITISTSNVITAPADAEKLKLTLSASTGVFTGSFLPPGGKTTRLIYGVLRDLPAANGKGIGLFFDGANGGQVDFIP